jgi:hypothetical protein
MKKAAVTFLSFLLFNLSFGLSRAEEKVEVKANLPGVQVEYEKGDKPPPQPVEKQVVVKEQEKKGCDCNMNPTATADQAIFGVAVFIMIGFISRFILSRKKTITKN